ncbi:MAG: fimbria major subunit [Muribaculaceae bacterium]|nr:fimbria major subunit [Muribaculaceae bacterium]
MKLSRFVALSLMTAAVFPFVTSCSSDPNPFDITISSEKTAITTIQLRLGIEETRAGELSTSAEKEIKKVTVLVFNEKEELEINKSVAVAAGTNTVNLEVSNGLKTIYVVAARSNVNPAVGTSITNYENSVFISSLANLNTSDGFVMIGKSSEQQVMIAASEDELPASNIFEIKLVRLIAKAQVKSAGIDGSSFGINFGDASFKACQLSERMRVLHNGSDVFESFVDGNNNGTYDYYSLRETANYTNAVSSDFTADGCEYMSENIVQKPVSGNTTFLSIRYATTPVKYYTFDSATSSVKTLDETPTPSTTYYAVAIQDKTNGVVDYALDNATKHIIAFKTQEDANRYMNSLNNGDSSTITVSQTDSPLRAGSVITEADNVAQFEVITFNDGYAYYRVNIAHQETSGDSDKSTIKVMRNKFYKVNIKSVKSLGFGSEALLRPSNPAAVLDAEGHSWISASISIADWDEVNQNVDL